MFENEKQKKISFPFKEVNNLIVIPVTINNSDTLKFILDSGTSLSIVSSAQIAKHANLNQKQIRNINMKGLGKQGQLKAYHSWGNIIKIKGLISYNQDVLYPETDIYHLSENLGTHVDGIIGYNFFKGLVVEIDYIKDNITVYDPVYFENKVSKRKKRNATVLPLKIKKNKGFISASLQNSDRDMDNLDLLVDTGSSGAISLLEHSANGIKVPHKAVKTYLGIGISGDIYGRIYKGKNFELGKYQLEEPIIVYPEKEAVRGVLDQHKGRHGSIGADVLKRFKVILNYPKEEIILKKNRYFSQPFHYNLSGIAIRVPFPGLNYYEVYKVRDNSPADQAGIDIGDRLVSINGMDTQHISYDELLGHLQKKEGSTVKMVVQKSTRIHKTKFKLIDIFED